MTTDQVVGVGQLPFSLGTADLEIVVSVLTEPGDSSEVLFGNGTIDIYDLSATDLGPISGVLDVGLSGTIGIWVGGDLASLTDFAFFPAAESDPAMAIAVTDNNGTVSGHIGNAWTRHYMSLYAPTDSAAWKRAAYAAVGLVYKAMPTGTVQHLDDVQWEIAPMGVNVPLSYVPARTIDVKVRPTRLNYSTNPSFEVDTTDWTGVGATLTRITTDAVAGTACCQLSALVTGDTATHIVKSLIPGREYTASAYIKSMDDGDVDLQIIGDISGETITSPTSWRTQPIDTDWRRVSVSFTALSTIVTLIVRSLGAATALLDGVLVERGNGVGTYFDGASGSPDYVWEVGGTAGKARSYYYRNKVQRHYALGKTLRENVALGLFVGDPEYATSAIIPAPVLYGSGPYGSGPYGG